MNSVTVVDCASFHVSRLDERISLKALRTKSFCCEASKKEKIRGCAILSLEGIKGSAVSIYT